MLLAAVLWPWADSEERSLPWQHWAAEFNLESTNLWIPYFVRKTYFYCWHYVSSIFCCLQSSVSKLSEIPEAPAARSARLYNFTELWEMGEQEAEREREDRGNTGDTLKRDLPAIPEGSFGTGPSNTLCWGGRAGCQWGFQSRTSGKKVKGMKAWGYKPRSGHRGSVNP